MTTRPTLVTGAGGFVGANLVRRLLDEGEGVVALVRPGGDDWRLAGLGCRVEPVDLRDRERVRAVVAALAPRRVFHLAAHGAYSWQGDRAAIFASTLMGLVNLLDACETVPPDVFVQAGSSQEYGSKDHAPTEDEPVAPTNSYGAAKSAATFAAAAAGAEIGFPVATLRLYSVYGPYEDPRRLVPTMLVHAMRGELPPLVDPETPHDFVYVEDVVEAFVRIADARSVGVYNVGSGLQTTLREVVAIVQARFALDAVPRWRTLDARPWDMETWVADPAKIGREIGWYPRVALADGIAKTHEWLHSRMDILARYGIGG